MNGELKESFIVDKNGLKDGDYKRFDIDGKLINQYIYFDGLRHGGYHEYFSNGEIKSFGKYQFDTLLFAWYFKEGGKLIDIYRKLDIQVKNTFLNMKDSIHIYSFLHGPLSDTASIIGNIIVTYPFGLVRTYYYDVYSNGKGGRSVPIDYPGSYVIDVLNHVTGEVGKHNYGLTLKFKVDLDSSLVSRDSYYVHSKTDSNLVVKFVINDNVRDSSLYYINDENKYYNIKPE